MARAALGLTRHECVDPGLGPTARYHLDQWRGDVLQGVHTLEPEPCVAEWLRSADRDRRRFESVALEPLRTERLAGIPDPIPGRTSTVSLR